MGDADTSGEVLGSPLGRGLKGLAAFAIEVGHLSSHVSVTSRRTFGYRILDREEIDLR